MNDILFVCEMNKMRSPTAEHVARLKGLRADSAGTDNSAVRQVDEYMLDKAENIVCFGWSQMDYILKLAPERQVLVWDIPDNYEYCHPVLMKMLEELIENVFCV